MSTDEELPIISWKRRNSKYCTVSENFELFPRSSQNEKYILYIGFFG